MFNQYTYKQKVFALIAIGLLLAFVTYKRAIANTLQLLNNIALVEDQLSKVENADSKKNQLTSELISIEKMIGIEGLDKDEVQLSLIDAVSNANNVELYQFPTSHQNIENEVKTTTYRVTITGEYWDILVFIYNLETTLTKSRIVSITLEKRKSLQSRKMELYGTIYFQNYEMV